MKHANKEISLRDKIKYGVERGVREALLDHKKNNHPVVIRKDGEIIWLKPEEIIISDLKDIQE